MAYEQNGANDAQNAADIRRNEPRGGAYSASTPAYDPLQPGFGFRMMAAPPEEKKEEKPQEAPPQPTEQVTITLVAPAGEEPVETGKKPHRGRAKRQKATELPLPDERAPARQLTTKRGLMRFLLLTIITAGIYALFFFSSIGEDMNLLASRHDGRRTPPLLLWPVIAVLTLGVGWFVCWHLLCARVRDELWRRDIESDFGPRKFWGWDVFGWLIVVGPFIFLHKLCVVMNKLSVDYNRRG